MSRRFGRALRGVSVACLLMFGLLALPAMAQVRQEGAAPAAHGGTMPLAAGTSHACAVRSDGSVACWGKNYDGQAMPPSGRFIALGAGGDHSCGIRGNGSVACWGRNDQGQASAPGGTFTALAAGASHTCGLRSDGGVQCWGAGYASWQPSGTYVALSASGNYTCALQPDGGLKCWRVGQALLEQPVAGVFTAVSVGGSKYACGLHADSSITCWDDVGTVSQAPSTGFTSVSVSGSGNQRCGGRPDGSVTCWVGSYEYPAPASGQFIALSAGFDYTCGLRSYGSVGCWGGNSYGEGIAPQDAFWVGDIASGVSNGCHVGPDGQLACWGYNPYGWNPPAGRFVEVRSGERYNCARQDDGHNLCWGWDDNAHGQRDIPATPLRQLDVGSIHGCAVAAQGNATCWGSDNYGQAAPPAGLFRNVSAGLVHSCGVLADGTGACWGYNGDGETDVPALPAGLGYLSIQAGERQSCGLRSDGAVGCWGFNAGEPYATAPPAGDFRAMSTGTYHSCGIRADGTLACWGEDWSQQLQAPTGTYVSVASGAYASCAIRTDGARVCWGINSGVPLIVDPDRLPAMGLNQPYTAQLTLYSPSGAPPTTATSFAKVAGTLPPGLSLDANGQLSGTPTAVGSFTVTIEGNGGNGFAAQKDYQLVVDNTPPVISPQVTGTLGDNGWYVGMTQVNWSISEPESEIISYDGCWTSVSTDQPARDYTCTATSAGGAASATVNLKVDVTAPTTTLTATPGATSSSYDGTFEFSGQDATAGLAGFECSLDGAAFVACASPRTITVVAGTHTFKVRAVDAAGNRDQTPMTHSWLVDPTPPTITPTVIGILGWNGWYVSDVQVSWSVDEAGSTITSTTGCNAVTLSTDTPAASFTCTATSAGGTTSRTVTVKRDATAPVITAGAATAPNAAGWHKAAVSVAFACSDAMAGGVACPAAQLLDGEGTLSSTARTVTDAAGNSATSNVVTVKIDRTAPTLAPAVGSGTLLLNSTLVAAANASDALSGVASQSCAALVTGSVGSRTVACTATDAAGNSAGASASYRVVYGFSGFTAPVQNPPVLNVLKSGRSASLRWRLLDAQGAPVSNLASAAVGVTAITCPAATENRITTYGGNNGQLQNLGNGYYQLDWLAPNNFRNSCRRVNLDIGDGEAHPAQFKIN